MTYKVYINKDYKPVIKESVGFSGPARRTISLLIIGLFTASLALMLGMRSHEATPTAKSDFSTVVPDLTRQNDSIMHPLEPMLDTLQTMDENPVDENLFDTKTAIQAPQTEDKNALTNQDLVETVIPDKWESLKVASGDNLSLIFNRLNISAQDLHEIMSLGEDVEILKRLMPDHEMRFQIDDGELEVMQYDINLTDTLQVSKQGDNYTAKTVKTELETRIKSSHGTINDSLFLSAQRAGLSDNLIMQMVDIYGWDIDFALNIREGDQFYVIYEEKYKDGVKVQEGPILATEFINQGTPYRAVRYTHADGFSDYYNEDGYSMRKAFLRTPVKFSRISSKFSLGRRHPILNTIRAHRGVDYAAPIGTPVKATGDGIVAFAGNKGGYGRVVILKHGEKYSTLYGHLSRFASSLKTGKRVKQGQIIAYVGMTGLATGPHLHYEFRINGIHHDPLTVKLPKAIGISSDQMADFKQQTSSLLAQLNTMSDTNQANAINHKPEIALNNRVEPVKSD